MPQVYPPVQLRFVPTDVHQFGCVECMFKLFGSGQASSLRGCSLVPMHGKEGLINGLEWKCTLKNVRNLNKVVRYAVSSWREPE